MVTLSLCMPWWHIGIGDVATLNLYLATRLVLWSASSPDQYTYKETAPSTHWTREWESPRTGLDALRKSIWHQDCVNRASADLQIYLTTWWQANHVDNFSITNRSKDPLTDLTLLVSPCSSSLWTTPVLHSLLQQFCHSSCWQLWNPSVLFYVSEQYPRRMFCACFFQILFSLLFIYILLSRNFSVLIY